MRSPGAARRCARSVVGGGRAVTVQQRPGPPAGEAHEVALVASVGEPRVGERVAELVGVHVSDASSAARRSIIGENLDGGHLVIKPSLSRQTVTEPHRQGLSTLRTRRNGVVDKQSDGDGRSRPLISRDRSLRSCPGDRRVGPHRVDPRDGARVVGSAFRFVPGDAVGSPRLRGP